MRIFRGGGRRGRESPHRRRPRSKVSADDPRRGRGDDATQPAERLRSTQLRYGLNAGLKRSCVMPISAKNVRMMHLRARVGLVRPSRKANAAKIIERGLRLSRPGGRALDISQRRVAAPPRTWIYQRRRVAAAPRPLDRPRDESRFRRRGYSVETGRGAATAATWIFRVVAAPPRPQTRIVRGRVAPGCSRRRGPSARHKAAAPPPQPWIHQRRRVAAAVDADIVRGVSLSSPARPPRLRFPRLRS